MEPERIVLFIGIILQSITFLFSKYISAIIGTAVTTFVLICGISVYSNYDAISFFGQNLPDYVFYIACGVWFIVDFYTLVQSIKARDAKPATAAPGGPGDSAQ